MTHSLAGRLLLASLVLLPLFLGSTGLYLDRGYRLSLDAAAAQRLQLQVLTLLAEAEYEDELFMPEQLLEGRFNQANSGLYGVIAKPGGTPLWTSPSAVATDISQALQDSQGLGAGEQAFERTSGLYRFSWAVLWLTDQGAEVPLVFSALETTDPAAAQLAAFRGSLLLWLGGATAALLLCQILILRWGLRPLKELAGDIARIERGDINHLGGPYPKEVQVVTDNLGSLLRVESERRERSRNTLSDLAHSLKTPLAVIRSTDATAADFPQVLTEQVDRMEEIISYQLQRASGSGHTLLRLLPVSPVAKRLKNTLEKVYADDGIRISLLIEENCQFRGDERDLMELLGCLLDNACKYCDTQVRISGQGQGGGMRLCVEDDGNGIEPELADAILKRGVRADSTRQGQGIGLAVAEDIARSYKGRLKIDNSPLGGARVRLLFDT
ncbi:MAG: two-component system sensor histidine kinase PhoQ [Bacteroidia bacterium]|jgi:two-component system sensor histidine kinase PhoQ